MKFVCILMLTLALMNSGCSSRKAMVVQTFSPIHIDMQKLQQNDYSDVIGVVNASYDGGSHDYNHAEVLREEAMFLYLTLTSNIPGDGCCRVTIDKNRSSIINMQPDCPVSK